MSTDDRTGTTTTPATTGVVPTGLGVVLEAHATGYAQAVRLRLADLGPELVDELTDGLEADLAEAFLEATAPWGRDTGKADDDVALDLVTYFGPATDYAAELRAAAGLPAALPGAGRRQGGRPSLAARRVLLVERWRRAWHPVTSTPQWARLRRLGRELRPVWWVARGWIVGAVLVALFTAGQDGVATLVPAGFSALLCMGSCALVSVQWARGRWLPQGWQPRVTAAASVVAVLLVPLVVDATRDGSVGSTSAYAGGSYDAGYDAGRADALNVGYGDGSDGDGVWVDGMQVSNLFAYDAKGDPIKDVQLFDDRGRPVRTVTTEGDEQSWSVPDLDGIWYFRPATADDGRERWNVYPLRAVPEEGMEWSDDGDSWQPQVGVQPEEMLWPFLKAPTSFERSGPTDGASEEDGDGTAEEGAEGKGAEPSTDEGAKVERDAASKSGRETSAGATTDARMSTSVAAGR